MVEPAIPAMDHEKHDGSTGIGMDGAGGSGTSEFDKKLEDRFEGLNLVGEEETDLDFFEEIDELIGEVRWLVMDGGPWLFRGAALVMAEYDGFTNVEEYKLDKILVWTRIQGIPEGLMKKRELAEKVAKKVGEPPVLVIVNEGKINPSKYLRARVHLDPNKPLH
jgi:hypothetical protein